MLVVEQFISALGQADSCTQRSGSVGERKGGGFGYLGDGGVHCVFGGYSVAQGAETADGDFNFVSGLEVNGRRLSDTNASGLRRVSTRTVQTSWGSITTLTVPVAITSPGWRVWPSEMVLIKKGMEKIKSSDVAL